MTLAAPLIGFSRRISRFEFPIEETRAFAEAKLNFETNRAALEVIWPRTLLALPETLPEVEWLYAKDGTLSGRHADGQWIGKVSIPARAATKMLGKAVISGSSAILLAPTHAQQIRVVLDRMSFQQALIVVIPGEYVAGTIFACAGFAREIRAQRLWFACGPDWGEELDALLETQDGIAPASMMIRVPGLNAQAIERIQNPCEQILSRNNQTHRNHLALLHAKPRSPSWPIKKICAVVGAFHLWDDAAYLLGKEISKSSLQTVVLDSSIPTQGSALKVARSADGCDAIVAANIARVDLPLVVPENVPWITWMTNNRIPRCESISTADRLILAEPAQVAVAIDSGWPASQVIVAQESIRSTTTSRAAIPTIIANLTPTTMPKSVEDLSSQRLVWERAEHEIGVNPLCIGSAPNEYLYAVAEKIGLARSALPIDLFRTELLIPTFMRSLALLLNTRDIKFAIYGKGWETIPELAGRTRGPVDTEQAFADALTSTSMLIDVWPGEPFHAARRAGKAMIRPWGRDWASLSRECNRASISTMKSQGTVAGFDLRKILESI